MTASNSSSHFPSSDDMRSGWNRATAVLDLSLDDVQSLVDEALSAVEEVSSAVEKVSSAVENVSSPPDQTQHRGGKALAGRKVVAFQPVEGGLANTNIKVELEDGQGSGRQAVLLKIFVREPEAAAKEFALNKLVYPQVPSPKFLHFAPTNSITHHPYALLEWSHGRMLKSVFPNLSEPQRYRLGESIGSALAKIHAFKFPSFGFFDHNLDIKEPITMDGAGLVSYVRKCLVDGIGGTRLGAELTEKLIKFVEREGKLLDSWTGTPSLTHADFNHSNILVSTRGELDIVDSDGPVANRKASAGSDSASNSASNPDSNPASNPDSNSASNSACNPDWGVAAVLDWEFAFSGTPFFDFGNLLRAPVGLSQSFVDGVASGYKQAGGDLPSEWLKLSILTDLTAWTEFLTRDQINDNLISDAAKIIQGTIDQFD